MTDTTYFEFGKIYREESESGWSYRLRRRNDDGTCTFSTNDGRGMAATITRRVVVMARQNCERFLPMPGVAVYAK